MSQDDLVIRPMTERDMDSVMGIVTNAYRPLFYETRQVLEEKLRLFPEGCWIADWQGMPAGYMFSHPWSQDMLVELDSFLGTLPRSPDCLYIHDLAVKAELQGKGIGSLLFTKANEIATKYRLSKMVIVSVQNSTGFWIRHGFERLEQLPDQVLATLKTYGEGACVMVASIGR